MKHNSFVIINFKSTYTADVDQQIYKLKLFIETISFMPFLNGDFPTFLVHRRAYLTNRYFSPTILALSSCRSDVLQAGNCNSALVAIVLL